MACSSRSLLYTGLVEPHREATFKTSTGLPRKSDIETDFASIRVPVRSCSEPEAAADDESAAVVEKVVRESTASVVRKRGCVIAQDDRRIAMRNISSRSRSSQNVK